MKERTGSLGGSPSRLKLEERIQRFLRPGALARLRDTRMISTRAPLRSPAACRHPHCSRLLHLSPPSSPSPTAAAEVSAQVRGVNDLPCFLTGNRGPMFPQRKKLLAAKAVFWAPGSPAGVAEPATGSPLLEVFDADPLLAH